ncbi:lanthionine synthetase LanC family protein [Fulvivirga sp. M361]|uniref:lanthionine synthetase LanC family protein n=1 Tax=Fulvivirga sp. M361 TaxID=2594266 RepID=UPI001628E3D4|nr:lanthionine synthetase LanC family protein [Fulvivirga sp. M361]
MSWEPILPFDVTFLEREISTVDLALAHSQDHSLFDGKSGLILLNYYAYKSSQNDNYMLRVEQLLEESIDDFEDNRYPLNFYAGIIGLGWCINCLIKEDCKTFSFLEEWTKNIDEVCHLLIQQKINELPLDIHYGLLGIGLYLLEKRVVPKLLLESIVLKIKERSILTASGVTWPDYVGMKNRNTSELEYSLGFHYGVCGILSFLYRCHQADIKPEVCKELILSSCGWMFRLKSDFNFTNTFYPEEINKDGIYIPSSRLWSSSELSIMIIFLLSGLKFDQKELEIQSSKILERSALQHSLSVMRDHDGPLHNQGLLYGYSGALLSYNYFYQQTKVPLAKELALSCYNALIKLIQEKNYFDPYARKWIRDHSLANGSIGIYLTILSGMSKTPPCWIQGFHLPLEIV